MAVTVSSSCYEGGWQGILRRTIMKRKIIKFVRRLAGTSGLDDLHDKIQTLVNAQFFRGTIEDCEWLKYRSFSPGGWAMDNAALYTLFRILNDVKPKNILEFGLGQS
jgi:hypothetical protein